MMTQTAPRPTSQPSAPESEVILLASMLAQQVDIEAVSKLVGWEDFADVRHKTLAYILFWMSEDGKEITPSTVVGRMRSDARWSLEKAGGEEYLNVLLGNLSDGAELEHARLIHDAARKRRAADAAFALHGQLSKGGEIDGLADKLLESIDQLRSERPEGEDYDRIAGSAREALVIPDPPIDWVLEPLLAPEMLTILQGKMKGGKSCFALQLALCAAKGVWIGGRFTPPARPRRTLFLSWEDGPRRIKERIRTYNAGMMLGEVPDILFIPKKMPPSMRLNLKGGERMLRDMVLHFEADLVVLDTLSYLHTVDENSADQMKLVMEALRRMSIELACATLVIHHVRKSGQTGDMGSAQDRGRGSGAIGAAADIIIDWGTQDNNHTDVELISKESPHDRFTVQYEPDDLEKPTSVLWKVHDMVVKDDSQTSYDRVLTVCQKLAELSPQGSPLDTIAAGAGMSINTTRHYLRLLVKDGVLQPSATKAFRGQAILYSPFLDQKEG